MESAQKQLEGIGLTPNEVKVYLASLELGAATAQQIAAKAAVVRPTAYVAIGGLTKRGLMSSHTRGKKQYYQAERPSQLLRLISDEKRLLDDKASKLTSLLPLLESVIDFSAKKPQVKFFEGLEGLQTMQSLIFSSSSSHIDVIACTERVRETIPEDIRVLHGFKLEKKNILGRQINIVDDPKKYDGRAASTKYWKIKTIRKEGFAFRGEIAMFGEFLALLVHSQNPFGILIQSQDLAEVFKVLFDSAWNSGKLRLA